MGYLMENYANRMYGITNLEKYQAPGVIYDNSGHTHQLKMDAGSGMTTIGGPDSHAHIIVDGVIKGANGHTHTIDKLYNSKEEFMEAMGGSHAMYAKFNPM